MLKVVMIQSCQDYLAPANYVGLDNFWNISSELRVQNLLLTEFK